MPRFIENNFKLIEEKLGFKLKKEYEFYVVRAEKFKSFSEPITVEYSILPEEMFVFLLKEIIKTSVTERFPDDLVFEQYLNSFVDYVLVNGEFGDKDLVKYGKFLHDYSLTKFDSYEFKDIDFNSKTMLNPVEEMYN